MPRGKEKLWGDAVKTIEIELSDEELCRIVGEHVGKERGEKIGQLEIVLSDDELRFVRFRVRSA